MKKDDKEKYWFAVEGIIGAGKSTYLQSVVKHLQSEFNNNVVIVPEPVDKWGPYLEKCGEDIVKYAYVTQTYIFHTKQEIFNTLYDENPNATIFISERSPISDRHVFWNVISNSNNVCSLTVDTYPLLWTTWNRLYPIQNISGIIYLDIPLKLAQQRCLERARQCELKTLSDSYQQSLLDKHVDNETFADYDVLTVDATLNYKQDQDVARQCAEELCAFIKEKIK